MNFNFSKKKVENLAYRKEAWTNGKKSSEVSKFKKNALAQKRSFITMMQEGHPTLAVDGDEDNSLHKCTVMDNYYTERPTLVINLGRMTNVGGIVIKTWQGKGQDSNFAYRDYMYGLDRFSVFVDKRSFGNQYSNIQLPSNNNLTAVNSSIINPSGINSLSITQNFITGQKLRLNENNLCNFVTRNNYAIFSTQIHLQCNKPLTGRYIFIQADGRSNRWSRLFSAVLCEVQVYEV